MSIVYLRPFARDSGLAFSGVPHCVERGRTGVGKAKKEPLPYPIKHEIELYLLAELLITDISSKIVSADNNMTLKDEGAFLMAISETILSGREFKLKREEAEHNHNA